MSKPITIEAGSGVPVLLIQGVGARGEAWRPQIEGLRSDHRVIAFDNRGIDGSPIDARTLSIQSMAADALAVLDGAGVERCHVVGHSMGGLIAQELALGAPTRVQSLAFLCTFSRGAEATRMSPDIMWLGLRTRLGSRPMRRQAFLELILPAAHLRATDREALAVQLGALFGRDSADQPPIVMQQLRAMGRYDAGARLAALGGIPTLVVSAREDRIALPAFGRKLAAEIPGARYIELADAGHAVPIHDATEINRLLREHFATASDTRPRPA